jgi:two-component system, NarL family, response regulator DegU
MNIDKIRVFILLKQSLYRQGLEQYLSVMEDIEISETIEFNDNVLSVMDNDPPDVVIVDIDDPNGNGMALTRKIKQSLPNIGVIAITSDDNDVKLFEALRSQAASCLNKEITGEQLVETVKRVARGEHPINESLMTHPILADQVLRQFQVLTRKSETNPLVSPLTRRETEILDYVAQGMLNKQIAAQTGISEQTIKNHVTSILRKLNANARTEAVILALRKGLISIH